MDAEACFAQRYVDARAKFLAAAEAAGFALHAEAHPMLGRDGEALALDTARDGARDAERLLVVSSGCHGVEGFCGSGVQVALLREPAFLRAAREAGVALVFLHALNPYGFSWWRRVTQENVDLNRNFQDFSQPLPANPGYDELAALLVPHDWPPGDAVDAALTRWIGAHGMTAYQAAVSQGQYAHSEGLFFGGRNPTWSHVALRHALQEHAQRCRRLAWIDVHTGLGPEGHGELICAAEPGDAAGFARARAWWGDAVTSPHDGSSTSAVLTGMIQTAARWDCAQAEHTMIALEYGTVPVTQALDALRADQWLENHPETAPGVTAAIKRQVRDAFYVDTPAWKARVVEQGVRAATAALRGLVSA